MSRLIFDIETDGLDATKIWCLVIQNFDTGTLMTFSDHMPGQPDIQDGVNLLKNATVLVGHNIIGFDVPVVDRLYGTNLLTEKKIHDTWLMSMTLNYVRPFTLGHGLSDWGSHLGNAKIHFDSAKFAQGDDPEILKEMIRYCKKDVIVNVDIYNALLIELTKVMKANPSIADGMRAEHDTAIFNQLTKSAGWNLDVDKANKSHAAMTKRISEIERLIEPKLGTREVHIDKEAKLVKFTGDGNYHSGTARMLSTVLGQTVKITDIDLIPIGATFIRTKHEQIKLGQIKFVKEWLLANGWKPTEYNKKKVGNGFINTGPKLTEDSFGNMGDTGELLKEFLTVKNRRSVIEGWLDRQRDGRIHGNMWTIGTPTFRARHEGIVNLPGVGAPWGQEIRELLSADEGTVVVGADSSGNQLRALCHYVGNPEFTNEVIHGDQHQRNADALGCSRPVAKSYLYAYLFGAGDGKLGQVLTGKTNPSAGRKSRRDFAAGIKGLEELKAKLTAEWKASGGKSIIGLDGRPVYCSSDHQLLNYLLQSAEGITCKAATGWALRKVLEEGLRAEPRLMYHDEMCFQCHPDDADRVGQICQDAFKEAPKLFNVDCMDGGDYVIGQNYAAVH